MRIKKYTHGVSVFMTPQMYEDFRQLSDERQVGLSELFRAIVSEYLEKHHVCEQERSGA